MFFLSALRQRSLRIYKHTHTQQRHRILLSMVSKTQTPINSDTISSVASSLYHHYQHTYILLSIVLQMLQPVSFAPRILYTSITLNFLPIYICERPRTQHHAICVFVQQFTLLRNVSSSPHTHTYINNPLSKAHCH